MQNKKVNVTSCDYDETMNDAGANQCSNDTECQGHRQCQQGWCQGEAKCADKNQVVNNIERLIFFPDD